jgi:hypothetical protein
MIEKRTVCQIVEEWLEDKDYFLVEVTVMTRLWSKLTMQKVFGLKTVWS